MLLRAPPLSHDVAFGEIEPHDPHVSKTICQEALTTAPKLQSQVYLAAALFKRQSSQ